MAYIKASETSEIRKQLKEKFPEIKFSVKTVNMSTVSVSILKSPYDFSEVLDGRDYTSVNSYGEITKYDTETNTILNNIIKIMKSQNWFDKSDAMTDYFHTAYYLDLKIGNWDRPYAKTGEAIAA